QSRLTGIQCRSATSSAIAAVLIARRSSEVCTTSGSTSCSRSSMPPLTASPRPFSVSATSTQPVERLSAFHSLSPWRRRTSVRVVRASLADRGQRREGAVVRRARLATRFAGGTLPVTGALLRCHRGELVTLGHHGGLDRDLLAVAEGQRHRNHRSGR